MISLYNVSKRFRLYERPTDRLLDWTGLGRRHREFYALNGIDLDIPSGQSCGIVGVNGAGKSTLLKLITGTLLPTTGTIEVKGRVAALLELGTGFHPEFTGRQNIYVNGQLMGLSKAQLAELEEQIIGFSELGPFIDQPLRTYSSGMIVRLGFSIASAVAPEVLIVDEALSVGDARFSQKCITRIRQFREAGSTILFVSHDAGAVLGLCDEAILLDGGRIRSRGLPKNVMEEYNQVLAEKGTGNNAMTLVTHGAEDTRKAARRFGNFQARVERVEILDDAGSAREIFHPGEVLFLRITSQFDQPINDPTIGFMIKDRLGVEVFGTNTKLSGMEIGSVAAGEVVVLEIRLPLLLNYGDFSVTVAIHGDETHLQDCYEWADDVAIFSVRLKDKPTFVGHTMLSPEMTLEHRR